MAALARKVTASRPIAQPGVARATRAPAEPTATIDVALREIASSEFARWSRSRSTSEGISPWAAGLKKAAPATYG